MPLVSRPEARRRLPTAERRLQLLEVAVRIFGEHGYTGASLEDIAQEVGISAPALYRHYPSKKSLYLAALAHTGDRMFPEWERIAAEAPNARTAFARIGASYQRTMREEPHLLQMRFRALNATDEPDVLALALKNHLRAQQLARKLSARADAEGALPPGLTQAIVTAGFMAWGALIDVSQQLGLQGKDDVITKALADLAALVGGSAAVSAASPTTAGRRTPRARRPRKGTRAR